MRRFDLNKLVFLKVPCSIDFLLEMSFKFTDISIFVMEIEFDGNGHIAKDPAHPNLFFLFFHLVRKI